MNTFLIHGIDRWYKKIYKKEYFLECLCRYAVNQKKYQKEFSTLVASPLPWRDILPLIYLHKLTHIAYKSLKPYASLLPHSFFYELQTSFMATEILIQKQENAFLSVIQAIKKRTKDFVIIKTYPYAQALFSSQIKLANDLDIFIPIQMFPTVANILLEQGYTYLPDGDIRRPQKSIPNPKFYLPASQEVFQKNPWHIELHTSIVDSFSFLPVSKTQTLSAYLYEMRTSISYKGIQIPAFTPTALFISIFLHSFVQHNMQTVTSYYELALLIQTHGEKIIWEEIIQLSKKRDLYHPMLWFLTFFTFLYPDIPFPKKYNRILHQYIQSRSIIHVFLLYFLRYTLFHPTNFFTHPKKEIQKQWVWNVIQ